MFSFLICIKCFNTGYCDSYILKIAAQSHGLFTHHSGDVLSGFELMIWQSPEGDDEDSCGINMIGKIPEGEA